MILFIDTKTTGLPKNWKAPVTDLDNWPRIVQVAWLLYENEKNLIDEKNYIIRPEGFSIPSEATAIHKITTEEALAFGNDLSRVLKELAEAIDKADIIIAHNMIFDEKIIGAEFIRKNIQHKLFQKKRICTMVETTNFCAIPGNYGYKWPTLSELYHKLFGTNYEETHSAAADVKATAKCFWELKRKGFFSSTFIEHYPSQNDSEKSANIVELIGNQNYSTEAQQVQKQLQYAGFWLRFFAWLIDCAIMFILGSIVWTILNLPIPPNAKGPFWGGLYIFINPLGPLINWLYYGFMESGTNQATIGKMVIGIKVTDLNCNRISFGKASGRFWGKIISGLLFGIGFLMIGFTIKRQGLHDLLANTLVLRENVKEIKKKTILWIILLVSFLLYFILLLFNSANTELIETLESLNSKNNISSILNKETQNLQFSYQGISFEYPDNWIVEKEVVEQDFLYQINCKKKDINSPDIISITWVKMEVEPQETIQNTIERMKDELIFKNSNVKPIYSITYLGYDAVKCDFDFVFLNEKSFGRIISFNSNGKTILIIKHTDDLNKLDSEFKTIENSLKIE